MAGDGLFSPALQRRSTNDEDILENYMFGGGYCARIAVAFGDNRGFRPKQNAPESAGCIHR
jgi:hypothetical protein